MQRGRTVGYVARGAMVCAVAALATYLAMACSTFDSAAEDPQQDAAPDAVADVTVVDVSVSDGGGGSDGSDGSDGNVLERCPDIGDCRLVFVTALPFNGDLGGIDGGDQKCQIAAAASMNPAVSGRSFLAWLSAGGVLARNRHTQSLKPYARVDGVLIARNWSELVKVNATLLAPINVDQNGNKLPSEANVWTGTTELGDTSLNTCVSWSSNGTPDASPSGQIGRTDQTGEAWTDGDEHGFGARACFESAHIYCFEQ